MSSVAWTEENGIWTVRGWPSCSVSPFVFALNGAWLAVGVPGTTYANLEAAQLAALEIAVGKLKPIMDKITACEGLLSAARHGQERSKKEPT
jgi:hypothetical protein